MKRRDQLNLQIEAMNEIIKESSIILNMFLTELQDEIKKSSDEFELPDISFGKALESCISMLECHIALNKF